MGSEYGWGTLRPQLAHQPQRGYFVGAKLFALLVALLLVIVLMLLLGIVLSLVFSVVFNTPLSVSSTTLGAILLAGGRSLLAPLPYMALAILLAVVGRSTLAGVAGAIGYWVFEMVLGTLTLFAAASSVWRALSRWLLRQNVNALLAANSRALTPAAAALQTPAQAAQPSSLQAGLVVLAYLCCFVALTYVLFTRRDVVGPG